MIAALLKFSLDQRALMVALAVVLAAAGLYAFESIPIDAFPDVTNIQVQIMTDVPGMSPVEVERYVTIPLEIQLAGLPGLTEMRSLSKFALSQITVVFQDDVDLYFARQLALERLIEARKRLPKGIEPGWRRSQPASARSISTTSIAPTGPATPRRHRSRISWSSGPSRTGSCGRCSRPCPA